MKPKPHHAPSVLAGALAILLSGAAALPSQPRPEGARPDGQSLLGDDRLRTEVILRHRKAPLSEVVADLARQTGVILTTAAEVADVAGPAAAQRQACRCSSSMPIATLRRRAQGVWT